MKKLPLKELVLLALFGAFIFALKVIMEILPNIEPVSLLLMVFTYRFRLKALIPAYIFVGLDLLLHGFNIWNIMYLYVWAILVFIVLPFKRIRKGWFFAILSGVYGMLFGTLCSIPFFIAFGHEFAFSWILSGLPFDLLHCFGNFVLAFWLYIPLTNVLEKIKM